MFDFRGSCQLFTQIYLCIVIYGNIAFWGTFGFFWVVFFFHCCCNTAVDKLDNPIQVL